MPPKKKDKNVNYNSTVLKYGAALDWLTRLLILSGAVFSIVSEDQNI